MRKTKADKGHAVFCINCIHHDECYAAIKAHGIRTFVQNLVDCDGYEEKKDGVLVDDMISASIAWKQANEEEQMPGTIHGTFGTFNWEDWKCKP